MAPLKAPIEKIPLTARKNVRDVWESKKPEYEAEISKILGTPWTIDVNANLLYVYAADMYKDRIGTVITWYMDGFMTNLKRFDEKFGADGKSELNAVCSKHQLALAPQDTTTFTYGGLEIKDGVLRVVFSENNLASNVDSVSAEFAQALKDAPPAPGASALNIDARNSIRDDYDPNVEQVRASIAALVNMPSLKLNPSFDANAAQLAKTADQNRYWDKQIGSATLDYFKGVLSVLERQGFKDDEMLQEGFQEAVGKGEICFRIIDKLVKETYNEAQLEDGVLYIQTTPKNWYCNVGDAANKLMDML